jgi:hypothetical protein
MPLNDHSSCSWRLVAHPDITAFWSYFRIGITLHEWLDIAVDSGGTYLMWAALACIPLWLWLIWTWPDRASVHMPTSESREIKQIVVTRELRGSVS